MGGHAEDNVVDSRSTDPKDSRGKIWQSRTRVGLAGNPVSARVESSRDSQNQNQTMTREEAMRFNNDMQIHKLMNIAVHYEQDSPVVVMDVSRDHPALSPAGYLHGSVPIIAMECVSSSAWSAYAERNGLSTYTVVATGTYSLLTKVVAGDCLRFTAEVTGVQGRTATIDIKGTREADGEVVATGYSYRRIVPTAPTSILESTRAKL